MGIGSSGVVNCANTYLGTANYTVADGYVADRTVIVDGNGPAQLNLNFARNEVLDPRITFSRTSNATRVNAQGLIEYAPHNLLTNSENFDSAGWSKTRSNVIANVITAPDGTTTADKFIDDGSIVGQGYISQNYTYTASPYVFSFYAKAGEVTSIRCYLVDNVGIVSASNAIVDLTTGTVTSGSAIVSNEGSGWYRIAVTGVPTAGSGSVRILQPTDTATANGFYIWGAQLNIGSLQPYYTTSVKNLLGYSQEFSNAAWVKSNSTIDATPVMGPFEYLGAMKLVENTAAIVPHGFAVDTSSLNSTTQYTFSIYAKAGERTWVRLGLVDNLGVDGGRAWFDLSNGVVGTVETNGAGSNINATITSIGAGWYRCRFTAQMNNSKTTLQSQVRLATADNVLSYTGDGTSGIYVFGAQLSDSASLDPYSYNFGAAPTSSAYYGPRFDYDPVTLAPKGLLIEEARTNLLTYSSEFDNAVWTKSNATVTANPIVAPDGTTTADKLVEAATNSTHYIRQFPTITTPVVFSVYAKAGERTKVQLDCYDATNGTRNAVFNLVSGTVETILGTGVTANIIALSNGWYRCCMILPTSATGGDCKISLYTTSNSYLGDGTSGIYIWGAQLEAGSFPTSYIPTTSAQVTRAADNASMVGTNFSSWYNQSEGTVAAEYDVILNTGNRIIFDIGAGGVFGTTAYGVQTSSNVSIAPAAAPVNMASTAYTTALFNKIAVGLQTNNTIIAANSTLGIADTSCNMPANATTMTLGNSPWAVSAVLNGHIKSFKFFSKRFINTYLQSLTQ